MDTPDLRLICPDSPALWEEARAILREYAQSLDVDICFQGFEEELASLPGEYDAPQGTLLLALVDGQVAGCGGFRPLMDSDYANACEMKRLFIRPAFRRFGLGRTMAQALIDRATRVRAWLAAATSCGCERIDDCALFDDAPLASAEEARPLAVVRVGGPPA